MTQYSYPWRGRIPAFAGDAGPYTHDQWLDWMQLATPRAGGRTAFRAFDDMGVFVRSNFNAFSTTDVIDDWVANTAYNLADVVKPTVENYHFYVCVGAGTSNAGEPTEWPTYPGELLVDNTATWECVGPGGLSTYNNAGTTLVIVLPGCAIVDGTMYTNDQPEGFTVVASSGAGQVRVDRIVIRKTYGVATQEARLHRIDGAEVTDTCANALINDVPAMTQDVDRITFWDVPLCSACVDDAGNLTLVDDREFVDAEVKEFMVPFTGGWDSTVAAAMEYGPAYGFFMPENSDVAIRAYWQVWQDYVSEMYTLPLIVGPAGGLDIFAGANVNIGDCGEATTAKIYNVAGFAITTDGVVYDCLTDLGVVIEAPVVGENVVGSLNRTGTAVGDTASDTHGIGMLVRYIGFK